MPLQRQASCIHTPLLHCFSLGQPATATRHSTLQKAHEHWELTEIPRCRVQTSDRWLIGAVSSKLRQQLCDLRHDWSAQRHTKFVAANHNKQNVTYWKLHSYKSRIDATNNGCNHSWNFHSLLNRPRYLVWRMQVGKQSLRPWRCWAACTRISPTAGSFWTESLWFCRRPVWADGARRSRSHHRGSPGCCCNSTKCVQSMSFEGRPTKRKNSQQKHDQNIWNEPQPKISETAELNIVSAEHSVLVIRKQTECWLATKRNKCASPAGRGCQFSTLSKTSHQWCSLFKASHQWCCLFKTSHQWCCLFKTSHPWCSGSRSVLSLLGDGGGCFTTSTCTWQHQTSIATSAAGQMRTTAQPTWCCPGWRGADPVCTWARWRSCWASHLAAARRWSTDTSGCSWQDPESLESVPWYHWSHCPSILRQKMAADVKKRAVMLAFETSNSSLCKHFGTEARRNHLSVWHFPSL